ncbi:hypothetical protein B0T11DRAFT_141228 [Plectosphaerella cucumerina]|uniref:Uncharacterized protein n=1 Tax=Plectosphaerella cucumerina TaxID=40658 RepID=A0A8K0WZJ4_9PEZI|nr:hypothetical protein B0T11DRAFT_141228 [Plectosphaerella cucumerina]
MPTRRMPRNPHAPPPEQRPGRRPITFRSSLGPLAPAAATSRQIPRIRSAGRTAWPSRTEGGIHGLDTAGLASRGLQGQGSLFRSLRRTNRGPRGTRRDAMRRDQPGRSTATRRSSAGGSPTLDGDFSPRRAIRAARARQIFRYRLPLPARWAHFSVLLAACLHHLTPRQMGKSRDDLETQRVGSHGRQCHALAISPSPLPRGTRRVGTTVRPMAPSSFFLGLFLGKRCLSPCCWADGRQTVAGVNEGKKGKLNRIERRLERLARHLFLT